MMIIYGRDSTLFWLNKTATILWQSAEGSTSVDEIVERRICSHFEVETGAALRDAETLAFELVNFQILQISEEPIPPQNLITGESR